MRYVLNEDSYLPVIEGDYYYRRHFAKGVEFVVTHKDRDHMIMRHDDQTVFVTRERVRRIFDVIENKVIVSKPKWELDNEDT